MSSHDPSLPYRRHLRKQDESWRRAVRAQLSNTPAGPDLVDILLGQARELLQRTDLEGSRRAAVVLAFTASEIEAEQLAGRLVLDQRANADIRKWFKDRSKTTRGSLNDAVRAMLRKWPPLSQYEASAGRRNGIVHRGDDVTPAEATQAIDVAEQAISEFRRR